jgi:hypothetical protein
MRVRSSIKTMSGKTATVEFEFVPAHYGMKDTATKNQILSAVHDYTEQGPDIFMDILGEEFASIQVIEVTEEVK